MDLITQREETLTKIIHTNCPLILNWFLFKPIFLLTIIPLLNYLFIIFVKLINIKLYGLYMKIWKY